MTQTKPNTMRAAAIDGFGGPEKLAIQHVPVPDLAPGEILLRVEVAGMGDWDIMEREGGYAEAFGTTPEFPYLLGSEGAGTIAMIGDDVTDFKVGDQVYAGRFPNPKGGFYGEYVVVEAGFVSRIPVGLTIEQAGVMGGVGITALRGLDDTLKLKPGETILIFGAGGGIGHVAVQLAQLMGAKVFAVASGQDGVALVKKLGVNAVVDGRTEDVLAEARKFAPRGFDTVLLTAGGEVAQKALQAVRKGGRVAYPNGVNPEPEKIDGIEFMSYNGEHDPEIIGRFNRLIGSGPFEVHVDQTFPLEKAAEAHRALEKHYTGKLALKLN